MRYTTVDELEDRMHKVARIEQMLRDNEAAMAGADLYTRRRLSQEAVALTGIREQLLKEANK
jgi:hypothetical protein